MPRALMVQGTASGVGKSWLCTAICRLAARRGITVVPFKAQNMSNNAAPARTADGGWGEIGRAQHVQALACGREPHVDMNPILLKPMSDRGSEVVVTGRSVGAMSARDYRARRAEWWEAVTGAYARLDADLVVIEGAGSPAEINLRAGDLVNMAMAHHADAAVLLTGDIDRGGVFAALHGTLDLLDARDRARVRGLVINRFRGDPAILAPGLAPLAERTGVPVRGVIPMRRDITIDEEDSLGLASTSGEVDVCVLRLPTVSNFTDLAALAREPGIGVRYEDRPERIGNPDLLVLPGSRDTVADMGWLRARRLDRVVRALAGRTPVLGLCGGYQMLGRRLGEVEGLGLLPVETDYAGEKLVRPSAGETTGRWLLPAGLRVEGYEIHLGRTTSEKPCLPHSAAGNPSPEPGNLRVDGSCLTADSPIPGIRPRISGALVGPLVGDDGSVRGLVAGTYFHGLFDAAGVRRALVGVLRERRGLDPAPPSREDDRLAAFDAAADVVEAHLDLGGLL